MTIEQSQFRLDPRDGGSGPYYLPPRLNTSTGQSISIVPSVSTSSKTDFRVLEAQFGDGYSQRIQDGINTETAQWNVFWNQKALEIIGALQLFLSTLGGVELFYWEPPTIPRSADAAQPNSLPTSGRIGVRADGSYVSDPLTSADTAGAHLWACKSYRLTPIEEESAAGGGETSVTKAHALRATFIKQFQA